MVAVDTNVLVRFLVRDEPEQASRAASLIRRENVWVPKTVLLETEWVLRSLYEFSAEAVAGALEALAGLSTIVLEDEVAVAKALAWFKDGLDFADALHLASVARATPFATFDRKLARAASRLAGVETIVI